MAGEGKPSGFDINGEVYEVPRLDTFDMDEAQIMYDLSGIILEDFIPAHPDLPAEVIEAHDRAQLLRVRNPAFRRSLVVIAYMRRHPESDPEEVANLVGKVNATDVSIAVLTRGDDEEQDPSTSSPKQPESKNSENGTLSPSSSGSPSGSVSAGQGVSLARTGIGGSDTSSPELAGTVSAS